MFEIEFMERKIVRWGEESTGWSENALTNKMRLAAPGQ